MTATIDLVVLEPSSQKIASGEQLSKAQWLFLNYTDTSGTLRMKNDGSGGWERTERKKGVLIDAFFGDGPERYGLGDKLPVVLGCYDFGKRKVTRLSSRRSPKERCLVERTSFMEKLEAVERAEAERRKRGEEAPLYAFPLGGVTDLIRSIPLEEWKVFDSNLISSNAFLSALESEGRFVIPIIGAGLHWSFPELKFCSFGSSILPLFY